MAVRLPEVAWTFPWPYASSSLVSLIDIRYSLKQENRSSSSRFVCPCCENRLAISTIYAHRLRNQHCLSEEEKVADELKSDEEPEIYSSSSDEEFPVIYDQHEDEGDFTDVPNCLKSFAVQTRELIARSGSQSNTTLMLKLMHGTLFRYLPREVKIRIPYDARALRLIAGTLHSPTYFFRDFCPKDHHMFEELDQTCPICQRDTRYFRNGTPRRRALYYDIASYITRVLSLPGMLKYQLEWETRVAPAGTYRDAVDGSIIRGEGNSRIFEQVLDEDRKHCLCMSMCTDATTVRTSFSAPSMTPITCLPLTLPDHVRKRLTCIYLAAVLPEGAKNSIFLRPVAEMFAAVAPHTAGVLVGGHRFWVCKSWRVDDLAGISSGINAKQYPATNGACIQCKQQGVYSVAHHTSYYMGSFANLPANHWLRIALAESYKKEPALSFKVLNQSKPRRMTALKAQLSGERMALGNMTKDAKFLEPYKGRNEWYPRLGYFNIVHQSINDPFHEIANTIRDLFNVLSSNRDRSGAMQYNGVKKAFEVSIGRSKDGNQQPFHASKTNQRAVDTFVDSRDYRLPNSWPRVRYVFEHISRLSHSELIGLAGPLGLYFLQFCDVSNDVRETFVELIQCLELLQAKVCTNASLDNLQQRLVLVLAKCELHLPLYWNTSVRHHLLHLVEFIKRCGPYDNFSMSVFERFHTVFKKLLRSKKTAGAEMQSIANHYEMLLNGDRERCETAAAGNNTYAYSAFRRTVAAARVVNWEVNSNSIKVNDHELPDFLSGEVFEQVQDVWARLHLDSYDRMRERYRRELFRGGMRKAVADSQQIRPSWRPLHGRALTPHQKDWTTMNAQIHSFQSVTLQGKYMFRTMQSERKNKSDNSIIKEWYHDEHQQQVAAYGRIEQMFIHQAFEGGPKLHFIKARWLDSMINVGPTGLSVVKENPEINFNQNSSVCLLRDIVGYNIALLPVDITDRDCDTFSVIDPQGRLGNCD